MPVPLTSIEQLWKQVDFTPNTNQREAILHNGGPLYLPAGPGSGKTRVLLWRTVNLIVFHGVPPDEIYLSTFTEKAAFQLREGLRALLGLVTTYTDRPFDLSKMYVGTVHSLCQRLIMDRRLYPNRQRGKAPELLDELGQYFYLYNKRRWTELTADIDFGPDPFASINALFGATSASRHVAISNCLTLFNRFSEECLDPAAALAQATNPTFEKLLEVYRRYLGFLQAHQVPKTDFALLQQKALELLNRHPQAGHIFRHVIVDEYQDTNTIQERLFFRLASGHKNLCVVGDDDQALYRFRGATVENFVQFPQRCQTYFNLAPHEIALATNYRSRRRIVDFYTDFISRCDWARPTGGHFRVVTKDIHAHSDDDGPSVIASTASAPEAVAQEIAQLVKRLLDEKKVENANQIAFLFPSLKYQGQMITQVARMKKALEDLGLRIYAPRAGRFLEVEEATALFGLYLHIFGKPTRGTFPGQDYADFHNWLDQAYVRGDELIRSDRHLAQFVRDKRSEIQQAAADYDILFKAAERQHWPLTAPYSIATMKRALYSAPGLSDLAKKTLGSVYFEKVIEKRSREGQPFDLGYVLKRATSIDWSVLDLFYRLCGFEHFQQMFDLAERGTDEDEGPICNLGLLSQYLSRFMDEYAAIITAPLLLNDGFQRLFFGSYLFALFRRGEAEYEDADDPFPKGRIPFLTIHQAKGLEFPVVILANPRKDDRGAQPVETLVRPLVGRAGEPLDRQAEFDTMRMFYVALSRAQNLLVMAHFQSRGNRINEPFKTMLDSAFPRIPNFKVEALPAAQLKGDDLPSNYSYTSDYLSYLSCPRQYMIFRKYGLVPSRSQTMLFGSLVHRTLDDLHQYLIDHRSQP